MKKRGISPLIATVLIIGFTIVLAALVMRWSGQFFRGQTEQTSEDVEHVLVLMGVDVNIKNIAFPNMYNKIKLLIENEGEIDVEGFIIRVHGSEGTKVGSIDETLNAFSTKWLGVLYEGDVGEIERIEVLPKVNINNNIVTSESASDTYVFDEPEEIEEMLIDEYTVAYWKFDGDALDSAGGINCNLMGDTHYGEGKFGQALVLDGTGDYADCGLVPSLDMGIDDFTIEVWAKIDPILRAYNGLIGKGAGSGAGHEGYTLHFTEGERFSFVIQDDLIRYYENSYSGLGLNDSQWHHFAVVVDKDVGTSFYIDGILNKMDTVIATNCPDCDITNLNEPFLIGTWVPNGHWFRGQIDEVRISNIVREF